ncbi:hypothetical protein KR51_00002810 [Rubidibacter lacunae KORDI 51-2]|uniref:Gluconokinase n=2 Tax=Rubidibacter TaxID=582491 RepID=U5DQ42_9CHRO|nr:bifunctional aminoglycoside phosphotransferase/ATP-binding protein [Rubidibacter lacunae]ERN42972.1 hypothetical protein KR51_00002810 [Rubidibacter lacunae KORDI 51-2]
MSAQTLPLLVTQMLEPEFYPHPVKPPIRLVQTHISYVFLTGDIAYKIKKAVDFGFLDFSTVERRKHFCHEELRMNREIAPDIYLNVVAIACKGDRYALDSDGEIVEYAVRMRQFPQSALLSNLFARGALTDDHLETLGHVVAAFHAGTATNDHIRSFGSADKIGEAIGDNYRYTQKYVGGLQTQQQFEETQQFTDAFLGERSLFAERQSQHRIRECHGDLHLKNICFWRGAIHLFDRIEFNESFRFVDVMYDVAFTVMDLDGRDRPDLGNVFLNTYLERSGDWDGVRVLPLYLCRQAYVRAKVNSFVFEESEIDASDRREAAAAAGRYYHLAWQYAQPRSGNLILTCGLSGSGKSTVARAIARRINAIHLRSDAVRKHLAGVPLERHGTEALYVPHVTQRTYRRLLNLGLALAERGFPVILDARYARQEHRREAIAAAAARGLPLQILHCTAPVNVLRDRLQSRRGDVSDATPQLLTSQQASSEPFAGSECQYVIEVDTTREWQSHLEDFCPGQTRTVP